MLEKPVIFLTKTRDLFCFCAFTSLRYSDMAALKRTDIIGDTMYITTQKTNDCLPINLNKFAKEILDKYAGRRTFICFALASGIPPQVVMKWTGHSDYKAMKPFIDIAEKVRQSRWLFSRTC